MSGGLGSDKAGADEHPAAGQGEIGLGGLTSPARPHGTIPALDGFRAAAIIIVMLSHVGLAQYVPGQFGVTLFFFLSGYLITTLLRRELNADGRVSYKAFYLRRAVRIIPPMWLAICLAIVFSCLGLNNALNPQWLPADFAFLSNYFQHSSVPIGLWSLAVEEHFYLLFPFLAITLMIKHGARNCALACVAACAVVLALRFLEYNSSEDTQNIAVYTHTRIDSILFGAILALWNNPVIDEEDRLPAILPSYLVGGALLLISFALRDDMFRYTLRYTVQGVGMIFIFNAAIRDTRWAHKLLETPPLKLIGALSYLLYLLHGIFIEATEPLAPSIGMTGAVVLAIAIAFGTSYVLHLHMERPLAEWRRQLESAWRVNDDRIARDSATTGGASDGPR